MSWSDRRSFLRLLAAGAAAPLAACGFAPVYAPGGVAQGLRGEIEVDPPRDAGGYVFVRRIEERLGQPTAPRFGLAADIAVSKDGLGVTLDQEITRFHLNGTLEYRLTRLADQAVVANGTIRAFTAYSAPVFTAARGSIAGNTVSVLEAERDANDRLMVILADRLTARLLATAPDWRG